MKIAIIGTGYVGLPTGVCLAEYGNDVICVDVAADKIAKLQKGEPTIFEPGLENLLKRNLEAGRISFTTDLAKDANNCDLYMICVGTPSDAKGHANLEYVWGAAKDIANAVIKDCVVAIKSTVPVGTTNKVEKLVLEQLKEQGKSIEVAFAFTPEFLKQGKAIPDTLSPDRIVIGSDNERAFMILDMIFAPFQRQKARTFKMNAESAEMTKYAANAMLATRISLMNEFSVLCDHFGADIESVRKGIGSDPRIGPAFLYAGIGYGGSCFPKDVNALIGMAEQVDYEPYVLQATLNRNQKQKQYLMAKIKSHYNGKLSGKTFGFWGLAFKPDTDDLREAPSLVLIENLINEGAKIKAYDPIALENSKAWFKKEWLDKGLIELCDKQYDAIENADAMVLVTEWKQFRTPDFGKMKDLLQAPVIFDGRNQYNPEYMKVEGFSYYCVGRN